MILHLPGGHYLDPVIVAAYTPIGVLVLLARDAFRAWVR